MRGLIVLGLASLGGAAATAQSLPQEVQFVFPNDPEAWEIRLFGSAAAVNGSWLVVGSPGDKTQQGSTIYPAGGGYFFESDDQVGWRLTQKVIASDFQTSRPLGAAVGLSGDTAMLGAPERPGPQSATGGVYVFERQSDQWIETGLLLPTDLDGGDRFGSRIIINGDEAFISAPFAGNRGAVYVFRRTLEGDWVEFQRLAASDGSFGDEFGFSIAASADVLVAGAPGDDPRGWNSGSAYIFVRDADNRWVEELKLLPELHHAHDLFGWSVDVAGDEVLVGAPNENWDVDGNAYLFARDAGGAWRQEFVFWDNFQGADGFGSSVFLIGPQVFVNQHVFQRDENGPWVWLGLLRSPSDPNIGPIKDWEGELIVVGDPGGASSFSGGRCFLFSSDPDVPLPAYPDNDFLWVGQWISPPNHAHVRLLLSDNLIAHIRSEPGFSASAPNLIDLQVSATMPLESPTSMDLVIEGRLDNPGGTVRVQLRNRATQQFETIHTYPLGTQEVVEAIENIDATAYGTPVRLRQSVLTTFGASGFESELDLLRILVR